MDNLFFLSSKILWSILNPESLLLISLSIIIFLFVRRKDNIAKKLLYFTVSIFMVIGFLPIGSWLIYPLETHFPSHPKLPERVDGIILLGGSFITSTSQSWNKVQTNQYADRIHDFLALIHQYPTAKAIFTGGSANVTNQRHTEAYFAEQLFNRIGIKKNRIIYENKARNTFENVIYTKQIAQPQPEETWIVVSTAYHLPRAVGIFCKQNWNIIPYPADFHTNPEELLAPSLNLSGNLQQLNEGIHEWLGLTAYYLTGKTNQWLPNQCSELSSSQHH